MIRMKTTAIASRLLAIAGLHLPVVRTTNKEMLRFLLAERRVPATELTEFSRHRRGGLRWLGWATRAGLIHSAPARSSHLSRYLRRLREPEGWCGAPEEEVYELTKKGQRAAWKAREALDPPSLSDRYHGAVWRLAHLEEYRPRRSGRLAVASSLGLVGYVVFLLGIFHCVLGIAGLEAELGEAACLALPILSMAVAVGLARAQRFRNEAEEDRYSEERGAEIREELEMEIESGQAAWEEYREDCAGLGYDPAAV